VTLLPLPSKKIVLLGMMTRIPVAGVVWQTVHYLVGLERLGYEAYYVETHARTPSMLMEREEDDSSAMAASFIDRVLRPFGFGDRWAFYGLHQDNRCFGMTRRELERLYDSAHLLINLHGGTEPLPELYESDRLVYLETDPVQLQVELQQNVQATIDFLEPHCAFFTFAENYGNPDCRLPVQDRYPLLPTRQPGVLDFWSGRDGPRRDFTTVGNWAQPWREVTFNGDRYSWSKHYEFLKFIDLPSRTGQTFELALSSYEPEDREMLLERGWHVRHALDISTDTEPYRDYIVGSRGEFTVAKDQNVRLRTGWFSDRSAAYLAAGRPVISQETGFSNVLPTGEGLFAFSTMDEILAAVDAINSDYDRHCRAAEEIGREYFAHDVVLGSLLDHVGVERPRTRARRALRAGTEPYPPGLVLTPVSRRPTRLPDATLEIVLEQPLPDPGPHALEPDARSAPVEASVVIVTHDKLPFTRMCLETLRAASRDEAVEVVVVDNGSTDGTSEYLQALAATDPSVRIVLNPENFGFARACNQGLAVARGSILVLLNNDALLAPGWLPRFRAALSDGAVGLAGPVTNRIGNEAEVEVGYDTWGDYLVAARARAAEHAGKVADIGTVTMFCLAMRRDAYERIGPLDQRFEIGLLEDDDYSLRAREAGLRAVCLQDLLVHHFGETSFGELVPTGEYGRILAANKQRFEDKWGRPWEPYTRPSKPDYVHMTHRIREVVSEKLPPEAVVLVVSRGDDELLRLEQRRALHFPPSEEGGWAGHHPATSEDAVTQLEAMREAGGQFLILPSTGLWWLEHYRSFGDHLERNYTAVVRDEETCVIWSLNGSNTRGSAG
jgi:GT2 family glycosyltransferase